MKPGYTLVLSNGTNTDSFLSNILSQSASHILFTNGAEKQSLSLDEFARFDFENVKTPTTVIFKLIYRIEPFGYPDVDNPLVDPFCTTVDTLQFKKLAISAPHRDIDFVVILDVRAKLKQLKYYYQHLIRYGELPQHYSLKLCVERSFIGTKYRRFLFENLRQCDDLFLLDLPSDNVDLFVKILHIQNFLKLFRDSNIVHLHYDKNGAFMIDKI